jgi:hypothetical protein
MAGNGQGNQPHVSRAPDLRKHQRQGSRTAGQLHGVTSANKKGSQRLPFLVGAEKSLLADTVFLTELLDATGRIDDLLLARIERVASRTHFNVQRFGHRGTGGEAVAATTCHGNFVVLGMDACFHIALPGSEPGKRGIIHKNP